MRQVYPTVQSKLILSKMETGSVGRSNATMMSDGVEFLQSASGLESVALNNISSRIIRAISGRQLIYREKISILHI